MPREVYQLRITLVGTDPPVWRTVRVPGGFTLDRVSRVIELAFGWHGYHLHSFDIAGRQYGKPGPLDEPGLRDELDFRLDSVVGVGDRFSYVYDFGDWWEHEILVESAVPADPDERYPLCVAGERAGPPEDVGGPEGYARMLAEPGNSARQWLSAGHDGVVAFDPARCEPAMLSVLLRRMT